MSSALPVLFLSFAHQATDPLPKLIEEEKSIRDQLHSRAQQQHYFVHPESYATPDSLRSYLSEFTGRVWLFHYAGHANSQQLMLSDGRAEASGIAKMLAEQPMLKLVFLNGCSTQAQVKQLLALGVPAVIATHAPIEDELARRFAEHFYHALSLGASIGEAFGAAANYAETKGKASQTRSLFYEEETELSDLDWGLFHHPDRADVLDERLPSGVNLPPETDFEPNQLLIESVYEALLEEEVLMPSRKPPKLSRKRMAILNHLPAPVAEHLRKLFVPLGDSDEGYNKISANRLRQLAHTYQVLMEMMCFTLLAQLWEQSLKGQSVPLGEDAKKQVLDFLNMSAKEREQYRFIPLIRALREALDEAEIEYFVEELNLMKTLIAEPTGFRSACEYFDFLRQRLYAQSDAQLQAELARLCQEAEQHLAAIFGELGYLGRYTLATVKQILVQKHRHQAQPRFEHLVVRLVDLLGGMDEEDETLNRFLDSQSVILLKEEEEKELDFLNLSPFIIDENAFVDNSDVSKIYFYHHQQSHPPAWAYRWVYKPQDPPLLVPGKEFGVVEEQMQAFLDSLTHDQSPA